MVNNEVNEDDWEEKKKIMYETMFSSRTIDPNYTPEQKERAYQSLLGTIQRSGRTNWSDEVLKDFFGATQEEMERIRKDLLKPKETEKPEVNLLQIYEMILEVLDYYMDMPIQKKKIVAIWIIGTYFHEQFNAYPYLFFNAMKGSGKTRLLKLISAMGSRGDGTVQNDIREAVLFRIPRGTVTCLDEMEGIASKEKQNLRQLLNAAYKKGMKVTRMKKVRNKDGETYAPETFEPYLPIAIANIWGMDEVLADRSITIILEKSNNKRQVNKIEDFDTNPKIKEIKEKLSKISVVMQFSEVNVVNNIYKKWNEYLSVNYTTTLYTQTTLNYTNYTNNIDKETLDMFDRIDKTGLNGRNLEVMFPLLIIGKKISPSLFIDLLEWAKEEIRDKTEDELINSKDISLIDFVSKQDNYRFQEITIKRLTSEFRSFLGEEEFEDRWLNERWIGRALKRLELISVKKRMGQDIVVILNIDKAKSKIVMFNTLEPKDLNSS